MEKLRGLRHLLVTVFISVFGNFMVVPAITDVTMSALCPGLDECSLAIYITGFQHAIIGLGTVVMSPLMGNLSDKYGRKSLLTLPMTLSIIPLAILAFSRATNFFYAYLVIRTLTAMVAGGAMECLTLAFVADKIVEKERASAFGIVAGVQSAAWVCGTLASRFISTASTFQVAAFASIVATVYMRIFLEESLPCNPDATNNLSQPILKHTQPDTICEDDGQLQNTIHLQVTKKIPALQNVLSMLKTSKTLSQAAIVSFFQSLAEGGTEATLLYFLKARFHFNKNQYADLMLIAGVSSAISQLLFIPMIATAIAEENLLSIGLLVGSVNMFIYSMSWSAWVPYAVSLFSAFAIFSYPAVRSIASKQFGSNEQGKAQGCISGISSFANIVSPFIFSPLTALFLSERAPINFPGFSFMCVGLALVIAFIQSIMITRSPSQTNNINTCMEV